MDGLIEGRIVHVRLPDTRVVGERHRPAIITRVVHKEAGIVNLQVFLDADDPERKDSELGLLANTACLVNVAHTTGDEVDCWHWIERA